MKYLIIMSIIALTSISCSPTKKLTKILEKHPDLITKQSDTVTQYLEIQHITKEVIKDTTFIFKGVNDTLKWLNDNVEIILKKQDDVYNMKMHVKPDTIHYKFEKEVITNHYYTPQTVAKKNDWNMFFIYVLILIILAILIKNK